MSLSKKPLIGCVIITLNEEIHIRRLLDNISNHFDEIVMVDSGSVDKTVAIAKMYNCKVFYRKFTTHGEQFMFGVSKLSDNIEWVMKFDADELITSGNICEEVVEASKIGINGIYVYRNFIFLGRKLLWGGYRDIRNLRLARKDKLTMEDKDMDEHLLVDGCVKKSKIKIVDHNLKGLSKWIDKHNRYSDSAVQDSLHGKDQVSRLAKSKLHYRLFLKVVPEIVHPYLYFVYRYIIRLGFLDRGAGFYFCFFQVMWYRCLINAKKYETKK